MGCCCYYEGVCYPLLLLLLLLIPYLVPRQVQYLYCTGTVLSTQYSVLTGTLPGTSKVLYQFLHCIPTVQEYCAVQVDK